MHVRSIEALARAHQHELQRTAWRSLGCSHDAADAVQAALLRALVASRRGAEVRDARAWLHTILRNECRDRLRERARREEVALCDHDPGTPASDPVYEELERRQVVSVVVGRLRRLPETQRHALVLRLIAGYEYQAIAASTGHSAPAVESLLVRGRRAVELRRVPRQPSSAAA